MSNNSKNSPYILPMKPGRYSWCSCGNSKKQPFCDGSHGEVGGMLPIHVVIDEAKEVAWCGCKCSDNKPYCDGTHKKI